MKSFKRTLPALMLCALMSLYLPTQAFSQAPETDLDTGASELFDLSFQVRGDAVNGWNRVFGDPARTDLRFVGDLQFAVGGVFNPDGPAVEINNSTSPDALMASYAAPDVYLAFFGVAGAEDAPNQNILYEDYPHLVTHDSQQGPLPQLTDNPEWWGKSNGAQIKGYTVEKWLQARGRVRFECSPTEGNSYELRLNKMVPGGLYTVWGFYFDQENGQLQPDFAFGGTSANVFAADRNGRIRSSKALNFCPLTVGADERYQLVNLFVVFHPDGRVNASVGHTVATPPFNGPGMTATPQLMFAIPELSSDQLTLTPSPRR